MNFLKAFIIGGSFCLIAQILIDKTKITPARILVGFVVLGCILGGFGVYDRLVDFAGAGATVPLPGFGNVLATGVIREVKEIGVSGIISGGLKAGAAGTAAAMLFGLLAAVVFNPKAKG